MKPLCVYFWKKADHLPTGWSIDCCFNCVSALSHLLSLIAWFPLCLYHVYVTMWELPEREMQQSTSLGDSLLIHPALHCVVALAHRSHIRDMNGVFVLVWMTARENAIPRTGVLMQRNHVTQTLCQRGKSTFISSSLWINLLCSTFQLFIRYSLGRIVSLYVC